MFHTQTNHTKTKNIKINQTKTKLKDFIIGMVFTIAIIAGIALTPYQASADTVNSIAVDKTKTILQYQVGSTILASDIYININTALDSTQCSTLPDVTIDVPENTAVGRKTMTVSYGGQSSTYEVVVIPKKPSIYSLSKLDFDTVRAYGSEMSGVDGYNFRCNLVDSTTTIMMGVTTRKSEYNHYYDTVELLKPGKTYSFKVRAYKDVNGIRYYSNWSTAKTITLPVLTGVDRWRPETKRQLLKHDVYSKYREDIIINIIKHESGGNPSAGAGNYYIGLMQFGSHWKHDYSTAYFADHGIVSFHQDNRYSGSWSLHRVAHLIRDGGGTSALKSAWASTWNL